MPRQRINYATPEKLENIALFVRFGLQSTLIKLLQTGQNLRTPAFRFNVDRKVLGTKRFENDDVMIIMKFFPYI